MPDETGYDYLIKIGAEIDAASIRRAKEQLAKELKSAFSLTIDAVKVLAKASDSAAAQIRDRISEKGGITIDKIKISKGAKIAGLDDLTLRIDRIDGSALAASINRALVDKVFEIKVAPIFAPGALSKAMEEAGFGPGGSAAGKAPLPGGSAPRSRKVQTSGGASGGETASESPSESGAPGSDYRVDRVVEGNADARQTTRYDQRGRPIGRQEYRRETLDDESTRRTTYVDASLEAERAEEKLAEKRARAMEESYRKQKQMMDRASSDATAQIDREEAEREAVRARLAAGEREDEQARLGRRAREAEQVAAEARKAEEERKASDERMAYREESRRVRAAREAQAEIERQAKAQLKAEEDRVAFDERMAYKEESRRVRAAREAQVLVERQAREQEKINERQAREQAKVDDARLREQERVNKAVEDYDRAISLSIEREKELLIAVEKRVDAEARGLSIRRSGASSRRAASDTLLNRLGVDPNRPPSSPTGEESYAISEHRARLSEEGAMAGTPPPERASSGRSLTSTVFRIGEYMFVAMMVRDALRGAVEGFQEAVKSAESQQVLKSYASEAVKEIAQSIQESATAAGRSVSADAATRQAENRLTGGRGAFNAGMAWNDAAELAVKYGENLDETLQAQGLWLKQMRDIRSANAMLDNALRFEAVTGTNPEKTYRTLTATAGQYGGATQDWGSAVTAMNASVLLAARQGPKMKDLNVGQKTMNDTENAAMQTLEFIAKGGGVMLKNLGYDPRQAAAIGSVLVQEQDTTGALGAQAVGAVLGKLTSPKSIEYLNSIGVQIPRNGTIFDTLARQGDSLNPGSMGVQANQMRTYQALVNASPRIDESMKFVGGSAEQLQHRFEALSQAMIDDNPGVQMQRVSTMLQVLKVTFFQGMFGGNDFASTLKSVVTALATARPAAFEFAQGIAKVGQVLMGVADLVIALSVAVGDTLGGIFREVENFSSRIEGVARGVFDVTAGIFGPGGRAQFAHGIGELKDAVTPGNRQKAFDYSLAGTAFKDVGSDLKSIFSWRGFDGRKYGEDDLIAKMTAKPVPDKGPIEPDADKAARQKKAEIEKQIDLLDRLFDMKMKAVDETMKEIDERTKGYGAAVDEAKRAVDALADSEKMLSAIYRERIPTLASLRQVQRQGFDEVAAQVRLLHALHDDRGQLSDAYSQANRAYGALPTPPLLSGGKAGAPFLAAGSGYAASRLGQLSDEDLKRAIVPMESGGSWSAVGPRTRDGDRAYGRYQIMGRNLFGPGRIMSRLHDRGQFSEVPSGYGPAGFNAYLKDPAAQDAAFSTFMEPLKRRFGGDLGSILLSFFSGSDHGFHRTGRLPETGDGYSSAEEYLKIGLLNYATGSKHLASDFRRPDVRKAADALFDRYQAGGRDVIGLIGRVDGTSSGRPAGFPATVRAAALPTITNRQIASSLTARLHSDLPGAGFGATPLAKPAGVVSKGSPVWTSPVALPSFSSVAAESQVDVAQKMDEKATGEVEKYNSEQTSLMGKMIESRKQIADRLKMEADAQLRIVEIYDRIRQALTDFYKEQRDLPGFTRAIRQAVAPDTSPARRSALDRERASLDAEIRYYGPSPERSLRMNRLIGQEIGYAQAQDPDYYRRDADRRRSAAGAYNSAYELLSGDSIKISDARNKYSADKSPKLIAYISQIQRSGLSPDKKEEAIQGAQAAFVNGMGDSVFSGVVMPALGAAGLTRNYDYGRDPLFRSYMSSSSPLSDLKGGITEQLDASNKALSTYDELLKEIDEKTSALIENSEKLFVDTLQKGAESASVAMEAFNRHLEAGRIAFERTGAVYDHSARYFSDVSAKAGALDAERSATLGLIGRGLFGVSVGGKSFDGSAGFMESFMAGSLDPEFSKNTGLSVDRIEMLKRLIGDALRLDPEIAKLSGERDTFMNDAERRDRVDTAVRRAGLGLPGSGIPGARQIEYLRSESADVRSRYLDAFRAREEGSELTGPQSRALASGPGDLKRLDDELKGREVVQGLRDSIMSASKSFVLQVEQGNAVKGGLGFLGGVGRAYQEANADVFTDKYVKPLLASIPGYEKLQGKPKSAAEQAQVTYLPRIAENTALMAGRPAGSGAPARNPIAAALELHGKASSEAVARLEKTHAESVSKMLGMGMAGSKGIAGLALPHMTVTGSGSPVWASFGNAKTGYDGTKAQDELKRIKKPTVLAKGIGYGGAAYSAVTAGEEGGPIQGALAGYMTGSAFGPVGGIAGAVLGAIGGLFHRHKRVAPTYEPIHTYRDEEYAVPGFRPFSGYAGGRDTFGAPIRVVHEVNVSGMGVPEQASAIGASMAKAMNEQTASQYSRERSLGQKSIF